MTDGLAKFLITSRLKSRSPFRKYPAGGFKSSVNRCCCCSPGRYIPCPLRGGIGCKPVVSVHYVEALPNEVHQDRIKRCAAGHDSMSRLYRDVYLRVRSENGSIYWKYNP